MGDEAAAWLAVVRDDLDQVLNNLDGPRPSATGAAYHLQQAAEKLVKATLVERGIEPKRTHDIEALWMMLPNDDPRRDVLLPLVSLTPYATLYRYPAEDAFDPPSEEALRDWLGLLETLAAGIEND